MKKTQVVIVGLYTYINVAPRILHPLVDRMDGVKAHTIFYGKYGEREVGFMLLVSNLELFPTHM